VVREFEIRQEVELDATPEEVWEAIATGPGVTSWFMPMTIEPRVGGKVTISVGDITDDSAVVTGWEPPHRLTSAAGPEGARQAFEYLVEARDGGTAVLRFAQQGFLGDNWDAEYESMRSGWDMYFHTLRQYLIHFRGRTATFVSADGPPGSADESALSAVLAGLGLPDDARDGARVHVAPDGLDPLDGVVDYRSAKHLGLRTADGLYRFHFRGAFGMPVGVGHHLFSGDIDQKEHDLAWRSWLQRIF
jgi:uncharacterized protein YndB with AHSA1/START domain